MIDKKIVDEKEVDKKIVNEKVVSEKVVDSKDKNYNLIKNYNDDESTLKTFE